jgi:hypothetical protein
MINQIHIIAFDKSFLIDSVSKNKRNIFYEVMSSCKVIDIDKMDYRLLNEIVNNARISLVDLSKKLDCSSQNIKYRLNKLVDNYFSNHSFVSIDPPYFLGIYYFQ